MSLKTLELGTKAIIQEFKNTAQDQTFFCRLMEMGLTLGSTIEIVYRAPFGGTIAVSCRGSLIALRISEAENIEVQKIC